MDGKSPTPVEQSTAKGGSSSEVPTKAIEELAKTQDAAIKRAPPEHTGILQIAYFTFVPVACIGGYIIYRGETIAGLIAIVLGLVVSVIAMFFLRPRSSSERSQPVDSASAPHTGQWSRVTTKLPIPLEHLNQLSGRLQEIRRLAQTKYLALLQARNLPADRVVSDRVRVNVFLPDTQDAIYGEVCGLFIPKGLHHGMKNEKERRVRFRPNQGLTGRVFTMERAYGALRDSPVADWQLIHLEGLGGKGDEGFQLTLEQVNLIDPELRWIVSFPLQAGLGNSTHTFGVLNIDGLIEPLTPEDMQSIYHALKDSVDQFAREVFKLERSRITIDVDDIKDVPAT